MDGSGGVIRHPSASEFEAAAAAPFLRLADAATSEFEVDCALRLVFFATA